MEAVNSTRLPSAQRRKMKKLKPQCLRRLRYPTAHKDIGDWDFRE
jgi:hypothetical protein